MTLRRRKIVPVDEVTPRKVGGSEAKPGFWFAACSCGWREGRPENEDDGWAARALVEHRQVCGHPMRALMVPMWSVAHPWYNGPPDAPFGLEMDWRPVGSHSLGSPFGPGHEVQTWHLFT